MSHCRHSTHCSKPSPQTQGGLSMSQRSLGRRLARILQLERLENRCNPSSGITLTGGGAVVIQGTNVADTSTVSINTSDATKVDVTLQSGSATVQTATFNL